MPPANFVLDSECTNKSVSLSSPLQKSVFCTIDRNSMYLVNVHFSRFWYFFENYVLRIVSVYFKKYIYFI